MDEVNAMRARRVPGTALSLSFLGAGVGHLYCGRITQGLCLYFAWFLVPLGAVIAALTAPSTVGLVVLLIVPTLVVLAIYLYAAVDSWRLARRIGPDYALRDYNRPVLYVLLIAVQLVYSIGMVAGVRSFVYEAFVIPTASMSPTLQVGDRFLVNKLRSRHAFPERGDLVVIRNPTTTGGPAFVKRVIGLAGDRVEIHGDRVLVNGRELERDRIPGESFNHPGERVGERVAYEVNAGRRYPVAYAEGEASREDFEATVPDRHVFLLGDNRDRSQDSRQFGSVHQGDIRGYVEYLYFPAGSWSRFGVLDDRLR